MMQSTQFPEETDRMLPRCFVLCVALLTPLSPNLVRIGRNIAVGPQQSFRTVTCYLCSVSIQGHSSGSVRAFAGNVFLDGSVDGNALVFGGNLTLTSNARIGGQLVVFGGHLQQDPSASAPAHTVLPPVIFLPIILIVCAMIGGLIVITRRMVREPAVYPPLPRL
jgi:hypothetical protein